MATDLGRALGAFRERKEQWILILLVCANAFMGAAFFREPAPGQSETTASDALQGKEEREWAMENALTTRPVAHYWRPGDRDPFRSLKSLPTLQPTPARRPEETEGQAAGAGPTEQAKQAPLPTATPLPRKITAALKGVMRGPDGTALALVWDPEAEKTFSVKVGDTVQEAKVIEIQEIAILLDDPLARQTVLLPLEKPKPKEAAPAASPEEGAAEGEASHQDRTGPGDAPVEPERDPSPEDQRKNP